MLPCKKTQGLALIVSCYNSCNYDIDFFQDHNPDLQSLPSYSYLYTGKEEEICVSYYHRARLAGVKLKQLPDKGSCYRKLYLQAKNQAILDFKNSLTRSNYWVHYDIVEIDVFSRVVVYLYDPVTLRCLNHIFLDPRYCNAFQLYQRK